MGYLRRALLILVSLSFVAMAESGAKKRGQEKEANGAAAREIKRRSKLREHWHKKELTNDEYFGKVYKPTEVGCQLGIKDAKKNIARFTARLKKAEKKSSKAKYSKIIKVYQDYIDLLKSAVTLITVDKNYNKLCIDVFPAILEQEKRIARIAGSRVRRDWLMTNELYPQFFKKEKNESSEDEDAEEGKKSKDKKTKKRK